MVCILDNRVAIHALLASAASPQQRGGLFVLGVPKSSERYFWGELRKHGGKLIAAAARTVGSQAQRVSFKNDAVLLVLPHDDPQRWEGLGRFDGAVFYGRELDAELVAWAAGNLRVEPKGWVLVA